MSESLQAARGTEQALVTLLDLPIEVLSHICAETRRQDDIWWQRETEWEECESLLASEKVRRN